MYELSKQIFKGSLSLVGAPMYKYKSLRDFPDYKPGVFGNRQLIEEQLLTEKEKELYELFYIQNYAIWLDIEILFKVLQKWKSNVTVTLSRLK
jgi:lipopolysaccharide/colanic/teichoic acid biosynthesis glycosyltransferase